MRCWACGGERTRAERPSGLGRPLAPEDLRITDARYGLTLALARCDDCGLLFAADPEVKRLPELYAALVDPDYEDGAGARLLQMRALLGAVLAEAPGARTLLDVGAATGLLVREAARRGLRAVGVEPSSGLAQKAREAGLDVRSGVLPHATLAGERFDLVTLVDVLEHVAEPLALLEAAAAHLAPGGRLVVVTPDPSSRVARLLGRRWWHFRLAHVAYYPPRAFAALAARAGLVVVARRPARWYFPVSYLVERVDRYLPGAARLLALARRPMGARLLGAVVPLDLGDSAVYFAAATPRSILSGKG